MTPHKLRRLLSELIDIGTVSAVQGSPLRYKVKFDEDRETDWIRQGVARAGEAIDWDPLSEGEQVLVVCPFGGKPIIVCSLYRDLFPQPDTDLNHFKRTYKDGTWCQYDQANKKLSFYCAGSVSGEAPGGLSFKGDVHIDGKITSTGDQVAAGVSQINHPHDGVVPGGGQSGSPVAGGS